MLTEKHSSEMVKLTNIDLAQRLVLAGQDHKSKIALTKQRNTTTIASLHTTLTIYIIWER